MISFSRVSLLMVVASMLAACGGGGSGSNGTTVPYNAQGVAGNCNPNIPVQPGQPNPCLMQNGNQVLGPNGQPIQGLPSAQSNDIVKSQAGVNVLVNRTFHLAQGAAIQNYTDSCNPEGVDQGSNKNVALTRGINDFVLNFDAQGNLTVGFQSSNGTAQSTAPVQYAIDPNTSQLKIGPFTIAGRPNGSYIGQEVRKAQQTDAVVGSYLRDQDGIDTSSRRNYVPNIGIMDPSQNEMGINGQINNENEISLNFNNGITANLVAYPLNRLHIIEVDMDGVTFAGTTTVRAPTRSCITLEQGQYVQTILR